MARIRTLKPEAHTDEDLWDLEVETGLPIFRAFTGMWNQADKEGRFEWRPRKLKTDVLPYWEGDFSRVLDALVTRGFLVKYTVSGRDYGLVTNFKKHQFINNREPDSVLPAPPQVSESKDIPRVPDASLSRAERVPDAPILIPPLIPNTDPDSDPGGGAGGGSPPTSLDASLRLDIHARAKLCRERRDLAEWLQPEAWPEVRAAIAAFFEAKGTPNAVVGTYASDRGVQAVVSIFAAGLSLELFQEACRRIKTDQYFATGKKGLSSLTPEVVRRLLDDTPSAVRATTSGKVSSSELAARALEAEKAT